MKNTRTLVALHVLLAIYSLFGIASKLAAGEEFLSFKFIFYYGIVIVNLGIYAIVWQQIIKRMSIITAYANKAVTVLWGIVFGYIFFDEDITPQKIIGAIVIAAGVVLVATSDKDESVDNKGRA